LKERPIQRLQSVDWIPEAMSKMIDLHSRQLSLAGIRVDALERGDLIHLVERAKSTHKNLLILNHNLHSLHLYCTNANFRAVY